MKLFKRFSIAMAICTVLFSQTLFAQNLGVYPTELNFALTKGQSETQTVTMTNGSKKKVQFRLYLGDWLRDTLGEHSYFKADTLKRSCSKWVTINKNFIELEPGQTQQVTVKLQAPDNDEAFTEMKWSMLFVETVEEKVANDATKKQATINNLLRIAIHIYQTPPTLTNRQVKVESFKRSPDNSNTYRLECFNVGNVMIQCKSYLELSSLADGKKTKMDPVEFPMFPEQKRFVVFRMPVNLPKGKYSALAVVDLGEDIPLEAMEGEVEIK